MGLYIATEVARRADKGKLTFDLYIGSSVQEENGLIGAESLIRHTDFAQAMYSKGRSGAFTRAHRFRSADPPQDDEARYAPAPKSSNGLCIRRSTSRAVCHAS